MDVIMPQLGETSGVLKAILVESGKTVPVGTVLAVIEPTPK